MRAGELRHRITIQQKTVVRDTYGGETVTWTNTATVWAAVEPLSGREYFSAQQVQAEVNHRIRIRYRAGITTTMRVLWGTRVFDILAIINLQERGREIHLMCKEVV